jgi:hypothetical protein
MDGGVTFCGPCPLGVDWEVGKYGSNSVFLLVMSPLNRRIIACK